MHERVVQALLSLVAVSATCGGAALVLRPHGSGFAPITLLRGSGFATFLVPGLLLSGLVGGSSGVAAVLRMRGSHHAVDATLLAGGALTLFIANEATMMGFLHPLHFVFGALGVFLLFEGIRAASHSDEGRHRWTLLVTAAEAAGFLVPAAVGIAMAASRMDRALGALLVVLAGGVEGLLCGFGQALALPIPVDRGRFALATGCGAMVSWAIGMTLATLSRSDVGLVPVLVSGIVGSALGLLGMGAAQWLVLRHRATGGATWIGFTALAWVLALPLSFLPGPIVDETTPTATMTILWGSAGVAMAYVMALVTWQGARRLEPRCDERGDFTGGTSRTRT